MRCACALPYPFETSVRLFRLTGEPDGFSGFFPERGFFYEFLCGTGRSGRGCEDCFAAVYGLDNHGEDPEWAAYRDRRLEELYKEYAELDVHADPILEGFNLLHDKTGVKRRKNIPASENLSLEIRQVEITKVDEEAENIFYIVQGNEATPYGLLYDIAQKIIELTTKYCGGRGVVITPEPT